MGYEEAKIENYLIGRIDEADGFTRKVVYQGRSGSPDRWCFLRGGMLLLVECKAAGEKPRPKQLEEMHRLRNFGQRVCWVDSREKIDLALSLCNDIEAFNASFPL